MVNGKPRISDQATLDQMEREEAARRMEEACGMFLTHEREFRRIAQHPRVVTDPQMNALWWDRLEAVYDAEKAVARSSSSGLSRRWRTTGSTRSSGACCWKAAS